MLNIPRKDPTLNDKLEALDQYFVSIPEALPATERFRRAWESLPSDAITFIADEIYKCKYDVRYYLEQYHVIDDEQGHYQTLYPFWDHQEQIFEVMMEEWNNCGTYRLIILKPRQCGGTVWASGVIFHATQFFERSFSMMMAQGKKTTANIYRRIWNAYNHLPWWMRAARESKQQEVHIVFQRENEQERMRDPGLGSTLVIANAQEQAGVAIGKTIRNLHGSEVSRWPLGDIWTSDIEPSMNARDTKAFLESTAYGRQGLFWNLWRAAEKGESAWRPVFIPVYTVRKYFLPIRNNQSFVLTPEESAMRDTVKANESITIPLGFFNWRRRKIQAYINADGRDDGFFESYPSTPIEAFINSGMCAFPKKSLNQQQRENCRDPLRIGEIEYTGPESPPVLHVRKPEKSDITDKPERQDRLWIWEEPDDNEAVEYYLGADISSGESTDYTDITVYKVGYGADPNVQVAEWHGLINPSYAARIIVALGYWYHTCEVAVEYAVSGITTCNEIQWHLDYPSIYRWRRQDKVGNTMTMHTHWLTNHLTREDMINRMYESLLDKTIVIRNRFLIEEMMDFGRESFDMRAEAMSGNDDMAMANMIAICALHQSGKRQEWADNNLGSGNTTRHPNLLPKTPQIFAVYDKFGLQCSPQQYESEAEAIKFIREAETKYNIKLLETGSWKVVPISISKANTFWSPIFQSDGAEHELATIHGFDGRSQMMHPDVVQQYKRMLTQQAHDQYHKPRNKPEEHVYAPAWLNDNSGEYE